MLLLYVRFDGANNRSGLTILGKSATIEDIFIMMNHNHREAYSPKAAITVDKQLFPYRKVTGFSQYILTLELVKSLMQKDYLS